jgi:hypothetical protein
MHPTPLNKKLYQQVVKNSNKKFKKSSLVRSRWIVNQYVKKGGHYRGKRSNSRLSEGFTRWKSRKRNSKKRSKNRK